MVCVFKILCVNVCVRVYLRVRPCAHARVYMCVCVCVCVRARARVNARVYMHVCACTHVYYVDSVCRFVHVFVRCAYLCDHILPGVCIHLCVL